MKEWNQSMKGRKGAPRATAAGARYALFGLLWAPPPAQGPSVPATAVRSAETMSPQASRHHPAVGCLGVGMATTGADFMVFQAPCW